MPLVGNAVGACADRPRLHYIIAGRTSDIDRRADELHAFTLDVVS